MPLRRTITLNSRALYSLFLISGLLHIPLISAVNLRRAPSPSSPASPGGSPGAYSLYPYPDSESEPLLPPDYSYGISPSQTNTPGADPQDYTYPQDPSNSSYAQGSLYPQNFSDPQDPYSQSSYPQDPYSEGSSGQNLYSQDPSSLAAYNSPDAPDTYPFANDSSSIGDNTYNSPFGSPVSGLTVGSSPNIADYLTNPETEPIALCSPNSNSDPPDATGCHYAMTDLKGEVKWYDKSGPTDWGPAGSGAEAVCGKQWTGSSCVITIGCQTQFQATYSDISNLASYVISNCVSDPVDGKIAPGIGYYNDFSNAPWWVTITESPSHTDTTMKDFIADLSIYTSQGGFGSDISQSQVGDSSTGRPSLDLSTQGRPSSAGVPSSNQGDYSTQGDVSNQGEDPYAQGEDLSAQGDYSSLPGEDPSDYGLGSDSSGSGNGNGNGNNLASAMAAMQVQPSPTVQSPLSSATEPPLVTLLSGGMLQYSSTAPPTTSQTDPTKPGGPTA